MHVYFPQLVMMIFIIKWKPLAKIILINAFLRVVLVQMADASSPTREAQFEHFSLPISTPAAREGPLILRSCLGDVGAGRCFPLSVYGAWAVSTHVCPTLFSKGLRIACM